jgi:membrane protein
MGDTERPRSRPERARLWAATVQARAERLSERAQQERRRHRSVDVVFEMVDRDSEAGGGIIAGALAYRLFIWLLPLALVCVAGLGIASDAADETPESTATSLGFADLVSNSVASAAEGSGRWYALVVGIPILLYVTRSVLRALIGAHRLLWADVRAAAPRPTWFASVRLLVLFLGFGVVSTLAGTVRAWSPGFGVLATLAAALPYAALWVLVTVRLPHRGASWIALVPGALLLGLGMELLHVVTAYFIGPYALAKQGTYGALGIAAALLFGLYLASRLITTAAVLNATLWERRTRAA